MSRHIINFARKANRYYQKVRHDADESNDHREVGEPTRKQQFLDRPHTDEAPGEDRDVVAAE